MATIMFLFSCKQDGFSNNEVIAQSEYIYCMSVLLEYIDLHYVPCQYVGYDLKLFLLVIN